MQNECMERPILLPARAGNRWVMPLHATGLAALLQLTSLLGTQACQLLGVKVAADANELHRIGSVVGNAVR